MFILSKKTLDMAKTRGFELTLEEGLTSDGSLLLCIWENGQDSEWLFSYQHTGHQLVWHGNVYAPKHVVAQLPKVIDDEFELREMLRDLAGLTKNNSDHAGDVKRRPSTGYTRPRWVDNDRRALMGNRSHVGGCSLF